MFLKACSNTGPNFSAKEPWNERRALRAAIARRQMERHFPLNRLYCVYYSKVQKETARFNGVPAGTQVQDSVLVSGCPMSVSLIASSAPRIEMDQTLVNGAVEQLSRTMQIAFFADERLFSFETRQRENAEAPCMISVRGKNKMGPDEIRAEIERRRKRAKDPKLRELLWEFYQSNLKYLAERLTKDAELVYPEIKDTLEICDKYFRFRIGEMSFRLFYEEEPSERGGWFGRGERNETTTTPIRIALEVDEKRVFEFKMTKSVTSTPEMSSTSSRIVRAAARMPYPPI